MHAFLADYFIQTSSAVPSTFSRRAQCCRLHVGGSMPLSGTPLGMHRLHMEDVGGYKRHKATDIPLIALGSYFSRVLLKRPLSPRCRQNVSPTIHLFRSLHLILPCISFAMDRTCGASEVRRNVFHHAKSNQRPLGRHLDSHATTDRVWKPTTASVQP